MTNMETRTYTRFNKVSQRALFCTLCIIIIFAPSHKCQESCPVGWIGRRDRCYKLYNERLSWQLATAQCAFDDSFLTSIVSRQENEFLVESFSNVASFAWIGMTSRGRWLDGLTSQLFHNDFRYETRSGLHCTFLDLDRDGLWNVSNCKESELKFICKMTLVEEEEDEGLTGVDDTNSYDQITRSDGKKLLIWLFGFFFVVFMTFLCTVKRNIMWKRTSKCLVNGCTHLVNALNFIFECVCMCGMCSYIYECFCIVGRGIQLCFNTCIHCTCLNRIGHERRASTISESDHATRDPLATYHTVVGVVSVSSETHDHSPTVSTAPPEPPPPYDTTSDNPPPSYVEALDPTFDDVTNSIEAPPYDSVV